jgi:DNA polymerase III epsilon subunit family exonuclease
MPLRKIEFCGILSSWNRKGEMSMLPSEPPAKSILISAQRYVALDIETTGLDPALGQILELAAVRVEDGKITERFSQLIRPTKPISPFITQLTGIDDRMVADAPSIQEVLPAFLEFLGEDLILGHNTAFDLRFIRYHSMVVLKRKV